MTKRSILKIFIIHALRASLLCAIGLLGVYIFKFFSLPLPWLLGPIVATAIISRFDKLPISKPRYLDFPSRMILGLAIASSFTPAIIPQIATYIISLLLIIPFVLCIAIFGSWYYVRVAKMDVMTAFFSSMPGGLLEMVNLGEAKGANVRVITMTQSARVLMIVAVLPFILDIFFHITLDKGMHIAPSFADVSMREILILAVAGTIGWFIAEKIKIAGSVIIGAMLGGIVVYSTGIVEHKPPEEFLLFAQLILGVVIGASFKGVSRYELLLTLRATFGYFIVISIISAIFMTLAYFITGFDIVSVILAFSPGGQSEMMIVAMVISGNIPYIALHHVSRIFIIMGLSPIISKWLENKAKNR